LLRGRRKVEVNGLPTLNDSLKGNAMNQVGVIQEKTMGGFVMPMESTGAGLCVTCNNAGTCVHRKRRGTDAIYCETFDDYVPSNGRGPKKAAPVVVMTKVAEGPAKARGLCLNCAHRDACKLSIPETGVWHCEEYE